MCRRNGGLTLIELLVVLLVILTLALIAIPPFLNARLRADVARVNQDLQYLESAIEFYYLDHKRYPESSDDLVLSQSKSGNGDSEGLLRLTTPVKYIDHLPEDRFHDWRLLDSSELTYHFGSGSPNGVKRKEHVLPAWILVSVGPDNILNSKGIDNFPFGTRVTEYSPDNGLRSEGDIVRYGGEWTQGDWFLNEKRIKPADDF
ncbi:MAG: prepilin-type N-terminal cleavage/methylation domain-containing protein [Candidatus Omnitrophica bacterium]|nr:prepilin-type N-terminal cleavage/methylation domain-containing protein [Candidatus Omnitrophota bacterium]MCA9440505.1 prepilin-type N-terminal cleavage/methylation domain-containing protein [Candidatus Omnitrophota bacterium]MCB9782773.1 prepilin-type N-terminal cleavage/methylation domain-containing protein [Candidatus Omnitrophota bacterium]